MTDHHNILDRVGVQLISSSEPTIERPVPGRAAEGLFATQDAVPDRQAEHITRLSRRRCGGARAGGEGELERAGIVRSGEGVIDLDKDLERAKRDVPPLGEEWETLGGQREGQRLCIRRAGRVQEAIPLAWVLVAQADQARQPFLVLVALRPVPRKPEGALSPCPTLWPAICPPSNCRRSKGSRADGRHP